jgi:CDP-paratose 2-epimerase
MHKTILITGGAGFIGSNLSVYLKKKYPKSRIIALDSLKRRGSELNLIRLKSNGIDFIHGDIRCREDLGLGVKISLIIDCSAEPSVLADLESGPEYVINTNLLGMINCLELARKHKSDFIFLSTSRVYPYDKINSIKIKEEKSRFAWKADQKIPGLSAKGINEGFSLEGPRSLYGATKLSCELLLTEYIHNYGIKGIVNRCGVVAGPWQFGKVDQGVFSLWMINHYFKKPLSYIGYEGKGKQVRDLLHIDDLCALIDMQIKDMDTGSGRVYNVGGGNDVSLSLLETTALCEKITGNKIRIDSKKHNRPLDVPVYITDTSKVRSAYGWKPVSSKEKILKDIYNWLKQVESPSLRGSPEGTTEAIISPYKQHLSF